MKDPAKNPEFISSFSFTGTISGIEKNAKTLSLLIHQDVAGGRLPTDYKVIVPLAAVQTEEFPYMQGDTVLVEDALLYIKESEVRLRISDMDQVRGTTASPGELNTLSFSGKVVDVKEDQNFSLVSLEQTVKDMYVTKLDVVIPNTLKFERPPKSGDIGCISHALFYEKGGVFRAKLKRTESYKCLYTPDIVMDMGTIEAKELFI